MSSIGINLVTSSLAKDNKSNSVFVYTFSLFPALSNSSLTIANSEKVSHLLIFSILVSLIYLAEIGVSKDSSITSFPAGAPVLSYSFIVVQLSLSNEYSSLNLFHLSELPPPFLPITNLIPSSFISFPKSKPINSPAKDVSPLRVLYHTPVLSSPSKRLASFPS